jgi:glyoxylase-like metal-dependent hydrolase (beta-lactamase superfamily II)
MKNIRSAWIGTEWMLAVAVFTAGAAFGQGARQPAFDMSGYWEAGAVAGAPVFSGFQQDAGLGTAAGELADYTGLPINEADRLYALAYSASRLTLRQHQCFGYVSPYVFTAPGNYRFFEERDPYTEALIAIKLLTPGNGHRGTANETIWMDGRPHPPAYAQHTWGGFSTGKFEGDMLTVYTTHMKRGLMRGNGVGQSDQAAVSEHFIRHGDRITYFSVTTDPVFLAEPFSKTSEMVRLAVDPNAWFQPCDDGEVLLGQPKDRVPNYLWGQHPFLREFSDRHKVPLLAALGGPETIYPEFAAKLKDAAAADAAAQAELLPSGPQQASRALDPDPHDGEIHVLPVQGNIYMLIGDGGNIAVQVGAEQGPLVVDTGAGRLSDKVIAAIRKLSDKPIQFIVNTSIHADHTGGNIKLRAAGQDPDAGSPGSFFSTAFADAGRGATIIGHQNVENRLSAPAGNAAPMASEGWPTDTYVEGRRRKIHNGDPVEIFWEPNAITDGDSIVQFRRSDVIVTGDILNTTQYPFIDVNNGGSVQGEIAALNDILDRTVSFKQEEGTLLIPGHGRLCDEWEVTEYRDMVVIVRDRVQAMIKKGATVAQVKAARVTADYDTRLGATSGPWTTDMFVEAVYTSLQQAKSAARK